MIIHRLLARLTALAIVAPGPLLQANASDIADARELVQAYYSRFQKPGFFVDDLMDFYADDVRFTDPTFEIVAQGKAEVRKLYAELGTERTAYQRIQWDISAVIAEDERVVVRGKWSGSFQECPFDIEFMTLWTLRDGVIAEQNDFFAASAFDRQVGWNAETGTAECRAK